MSENIIFWFISVNYSYLIQLAQFTNDFSIECGHQFDLLMQKLIATTEKKETQGQ